MRKQFPLFQSHLDFARAYWKALLTNKKHYSVIDATMGNGHDTLFLAEQLFLSNSQLIALDINSKAIEATRKRLIEEQFLPSLENGAIRLLLQSHVELDQIELLNPCLLIVYNLGYLPGGGTKEQTTKSETTLESIQKAIKLIRPGGAISITAYPGHTEGRQECNDLRDFVYQQLSADKEWNITFHSWMNRPQTEAALAPCLFLLQKAL